MKKLLITLAVLLLAAPAMATVEITAVAGPGPNDVTVGFTASGEAELVRAIALDVVLNDANAVIADINCVNADYGIYPGSISIDASGNVTDWGTCAGAGLDSNDVATEQGSLYVGTANEPAQNGTLFIITIEGCTVNPGGDVTVSITEDALRGGVVLEDPDVAASVTLPGDVTVTICEFDDPVCSCPGDVDGNGFINTADLGQLIGALTNAGAPYIIPSAGPQDCRDYDGNGFINTADLGQVIGALTAAGAPYIITCP